eukprot:4685038-Amphidinium_carterae.1
MDAFSVLWQEHNVVFCRHIDSVLDSRSLLSTWSYSNHRIEAVGLYVDDILAGATKTTCQGLMTWAKSVWTTGQVDFAGPEDPYTICFFGINLDYISKKQSSSEQHEGGITINELEYDVETLC